MSISDLTSLQTDGYAVVRNFLSPDEIIRLQQDYNNKKIAALKNGMPNKNYNNLVGNKHYLEEKIKKLLGDINSQTNLSLDLIFPTSWFWDTTLSGFEFHCEYETYYKWQNVYDGLNFWIPIIKPSPTELGLAIVPFSKLLEKCPDITNNYIIGKGAKKFVRVGNTFEVHDWETGQIFQMPVDLDQIADIPEIEVGDVIIMRGDCIHRTDGVDGHRVAASVLCTNSKIIIKKDKFLAGCFQKHSMLHNDYAEWSRILSAFGDSNELILGKLYPADYVVKF